MSDLVSACSGCGFDTRLGLIWPGAAGESMAFRFMVNLCPYKVQDERVALRFKVRLMALRFKVNFLALRFKVKLMA